MKKAFYPILTAIIIVTLLIIANQSEHYYTMNAKVVKVDHVNHLIELEDTTGNLWDYEFDKTNFSEEDKIEVKFYDKCSTDKREDDEIIKIKRLP